MSQFLPNPPKRRRPPGPFNLMDERAALEAARATDERARRERIPVALIGGLALRAWGSPRLTHGVDFAAVKIPLFASVGLPLPGGIGSRVWTPEGIEINLIDAGALYADAARTAQRTRWGFRIASPEHLVIMKLEAGRPKDLLDVEWLLKQPKLVDRRRARALARRLLGGWAERALYEMFLKTRPRRKSNPDEWGT